MRFVWPDGSSRPDHFDVLNDGTVVGRMYRTNGIGREQWCWTQFGWYSGGQNGGVADTLDEAKAAFRAACQKQALPRCGNLASKQDPGAKEPVRLCRPHPPR
jgi:hypothetical protein